MHTNERRERPNVCASSKKESPAIKERISRRLTALWCLYAKEYMANGSKKILITIYLLLKVNVW